MIDRLKAPHLLGFSVMATAFAQLGPRRLGKVCAALFNSAFERSSIYARNIALSSADH